MREGNACPRICGIAPFGGVGAVLVTGEAVCSIDQGGVGAVVTDTGIGGVCEHADTVIMTYGTVGWCADIETIGFVVADYCSIICTGCVAVSAYSCWSGESGLVHYGEIEVIVTGGTVIVAEIIIAARFIHIIVFSEFTGIDGCVYSAWACVLIMTAHAICA